MKKIQQGLRDEDFHGRNSFIEDGNKTVIHPCWKHLKKNFIR